jgi:hypothetical protein
MEYHAGDKKFPGSIIIKKNAPLLDDLDILSKKVSTGVSCV